MGGPSAAPRPGVGEPRVLRENRYALARPHLPSLYDKLPSLMTSLILALISALRSAFQTRATLTLENLALRQQLAIYHRNQ